VKRYGTREALHGIDLTVERGRITALLGPNGAGKSTAVALLLGLRVADAGRVELFGQAPQRLEVRQRIGVMLQRAELPDTLRVSELLALTRGYYPRPRPLDVVARSAGIPDLLRRSYGSLSGGEQRRVQFALAICGDPELLFLDEPTVGMDAAARALVWESVRAQVAAGCAVLLTTHYLEEAEALAQRVTVLLRGRVVSSGDIQAMRAQGARQRIRCRTALPAPQVAAWREVSAVHRSEHWLEIETAAAESVVRRLLAADPDTSELEVRRAGLAEVLAEITEEAV
jgi:ABC-2 type transport system ATP-binding protein